MARLNNSHLVGPWDNDFEEYTCERMDLEFKSLDELASTNTVLAIGRGDGYAFYLVNSIKPFVIQHIPVGDAWEADPVMIRGLTTKDIPRFTYRKRRLFSNG